MADTNINDLHPDLRPLYKLLVQDLAAKGIKARIIQGFRDGAYQDKLHAQGISPLTGNKSKHCCTLLGLPASKAFDLGVFGETGVYITDGQDNRYMTAGRLWNVYRDTNPKLGLLWGGDFVHARKDPDHFEIA